jgi:putative flippase GtrA
MRAVLARLVKFAGTSGVGVCLDYGIYGVLGALGVPASLAYVAGAATGLTFVFVVSLRHVFEAQQHFRWPMFWTYAGYQVVSVGLGALAVGLLNEALNGRYLLAKALVLPVTFCTNYLFMAWLLSDRGARRAGRGVG